MSMEGTTVIDGIEIRACIDWDNDGVYYYYAKGKHEPEAFAQLVGEAFGFEGYPSEVRHAYLRYSVSAYAKAMGGMEIVEYDKPGRGRFEATIYDCDI